MSVDAYDPRGAMGFLYAAHPLDILSKNPSEAMTIIDAPLGVETTCVKTEALNYHLPWLMALATASA